MHQQVGDATDGRGEVGVGPRVQAEVVGRIGGVAGATHGVGSGLGDRVGLELVGVLHDLGHRPGAVPAVGELLGVEPGSRQGRVQPVGAGRVDALVHAVEAGHVALGEPGGHGLVRGHHQALDDVRRVGVGVGRGALDAVAVDHQLRLGRGEQAAQRRAGIALPTQRLGRTRHRIDGRCGVTAQAPPTVEVALHVLVGQAVVVAGQRDRRLHVDDLALAGHGEGDGHGVALLALDEAERVLGEVGRQHRGGVVGEVRRGGQRDRPTVQP